MPHKMIRNFEDLLVTFLILDMDKEHPIRLTQEIKSKMSTPALHLLFNHSKTSTKEMDSNVLCWDVQYMSKFGYIILLEIPKETTNYWVNILVIERV